MPPKKKQEKMSLGAFLGDQSMGSWADEMDSMPLPAPSESRSGYGGGDRSFSSRSAFGGGGADRDYGDRAFPSREALPLPNKPPFTAHLGNLSFDVTQSDIDGFFAGCAVTNVRIVEDKVDRKPKGFGYVEFGTLDGLKKALELNGAQFQGRNVRISVAEPPKERQDAREITDWTRKGPLADAPSTSRRPSERGFGASFEARSDAGSERSSSRRGMLGTDQGPPRDFGNWERKGPLTPTSPMAAPGRDERPTRRNDLSFDRRASPSWGEGRPAGAADGPRPPRPDRPPPVERAPTAAETDTQWRSKMQPDAPAKLEVPNTPDVSTPSSPIASGPPPPTVRPRLNLQKRTVAESTGEQASAATEATGDAKASPFGAARPIDTTQREKEIEEKREAARVKKAEEDKAAEEKRAVEKAERAERPEGAEGSERPERSERSERPARGDRQDRPERGPRSDRPARPDRQERSFRGEKVTSPVPRENGRSFNNKEAKDNKSEKSTAERAPGQNFSILSRVADEDSSEIPPEVAEANEQEGAPTNGTIAEDKDVKPQEVTRDIGSTGQMDGQSAADQLEEEGWETVQSVQKGKKGRTGPRALAS